MTTVLHARPRNFVSTPAIDRVMTRALRYLQSGFPVHLRGPAGTGKTTLALHLADLLSRPIMLLFGDDEFKTSDLIGNQSGYTRKKVVDNFIHSVVKMEDELRQNWVDSRLTLACREGFTLVYDEFNRSRPEVNNVLLSALEEKLLVLPPNSSRNEYIRVNPNFRAIFTSNPEEYCGVHDTQDALLDRLITINVPEPDELTQQEITIQKIGIDRQSAITIIQLVRNFRTKASTENSSGLRACLMIAKICHEHGIVAVAENSEFRDICQDILLARSGMSLSQSTQILWDVFNEMIGAEVVPLEVLDSHPSRSSVAVQADLPAQAIETEIELDAALEADLPEEPIAEPITEIPAELITEPVEPIAESEIVTASAAIEKSDTPDIDLSANVLVEMADVADITKVELSENASDRSDDASDQELDISEESEAADDSSELAHSPEVSELSEAIPFSPDVPYEREVYEYLQHSSNARPSELEAVLTINRFQAVNALRSLVSKGLIVVQNSTNQPSTYQLANSVTPGYSTPILL